MGAGRGEEKQCGENGTAVKCATYILIRTSNI